MDIAGDVAAFNAQLADVAGKIKAAVSVVEADLLKSLKFAEEALPEIAKVLSVAGAVATMVPGAFGIGSVLATASNFITQVEGWVKGADGVITKAENAVQPVVALTNAEKRQAVADATANLHPDAPTTAVDLATTVAFVQKTKIDPVVPAAS